MLERALSFLATGQEDDGHVLYQCGDRSRAVIYHTAATAAAFATADGMGIPGYRRRAERAYAWVLRQQRSDGGFPHSEREHYVLSDRRSYPRYLAMVLDHLLHAQTPGSFAPQIADSERGGILDCGDSSPLSPLQTMQR
jgi:hypothetical protein